MAPQNPPKGPDAPAVLELANTKELGPYWTKITLSRRRGSQPTPPLTNTQDQTEHTSCSNQKLPPSELASKSNTREKQKPQECNQSHKEEESESDGSKMSSSSKTRLPKAAATYDLGIQDPELRQEIDASLLHNGHIATYVTLFLVTLPPKLVTKSVCYLGLKKNLIMPSLHQPRTGPTSSRNAVKSSSVAAKPKHLMSVLLKYLPT